MWEGGKREGMTMRRLEREMEGRKLWWGEGRWSSLWAEVTLSEVF